MAIQYYMRAYNTTLSQYVDWVVNDQPDDTGIYSPYPTGQLTNIVVNKTVGSKIDNFLQPDEGFTSSDGYFFHLNSFDWLHASIPAVTVIPVPQTYVGLAVTRGGTTNSSGLLLPGASTNFFSTLLWHEAEQRWKFVKNTNGDHATIGAYLPLGVGSTVVDGYIAVGNNPTVVNMPTTGSLRLQNDQWITARKLGNTDGYLIKLGTLDRVQIGTLSESPIVYMPGNLRVDGYVRDGSSSTSTSGFLRNGNNTNIISFRNLADSANIAALSSTTANSVVVGDSINQSVIYNTANVAGVAAALGVHQFQVNGVTLAEIGNGNPTVNPFIRFSAASTNPSFTQTNTATGNGQTLTVQAQTTTQSGQQGGILALSSGAGSGAGTNGAVNINTGGNNKIIIYPTVAAVGADSNSIKIFENLIRIDSAQNAPVYRQDDVSTSSTNGKSFTIQSQNALGVTSNGGDLNLTSGTGTSQDGYVRIKTGGVDRIIVSGSTTTINTNLVVNGITTTVNSTVVDIADRVIHVNNSTGVAPVPTAITGYSVHRGNTGVIDRDHAGLFWVETDSYFKLSLNTQGDDTALTSNLAVMGASFLAQPSSGIVASTPLSGAFGTVNNVAALVARNAGGTADLTLAGTNAANKILWGAGINNSGHIFNTTVSTDYDFQVAGASAYKLTPASAGATTLEAATGVTALIYRQANTGGASGAHTTVQAQNAVTTGGDLNLTSGTGATNGIVNLQAGGATTASIGTNKFRLLKGWRRNVTNITGAYTVLVTDDYVAITTLAAPFIITLPASPSAGDTYAIKDSTGNAGASNVTVDTSGGATTIDGSLTFLLSQPYAAATFTFVNGNWSVT